MQERGLRQTLEVELLGAGNSEVLGPGSLVRNGGHGLWGSMNPWPCRWHTPWGRVQKEVDQNRPLKAEHLRPPALVRVQGQFWGS